MTAVFTPPQRQVAPSPPANPQTPPRLQAWFREHRASLLVLLPVLLAVGLAMAWNLQGYPGRINDDEGTYTAEAWAIIYMHKLAPYTYWYDHPPLGWATIALWAWLTDGFGRVSRAVMVGREAMWAATMVGSALLYGLARRMDFGRASAAAAVLLFGLSPLAIWYHRTVSLDNLSTAWALAAFLIASSRRQSLAAAFWSAVCFAASTLSKETVVVILPALLWQLCQHTDRRTRSWNLSAFGATFFILIFFYPLFAILRGELVPGPGHVSLIGSIKYQLLSRQATGSLLNPHSGTYLLAHSWVVLDPWLTFGGVVAIATGFFIRRLRPMALALLLQLAIMVKGGYVPFAFGVAMLPFAALLLAGTADSWWKSASLLRPHVLRWRQSARLARVAQSPWVDRLTHLGRLPVLAAAVVFAAVVLPGWSSFLQQQQAHGNGFTYEDQATEWVIQHVPKGKTVVVDDYPWLDIKLRSRAVPVWLWKIDSDPEVTHTILPDGYKSIDYMELDPKSPLTVAALPGRPTLQQALQHAQVVTRFGPMVIYRVGSPTPPHPRPHRRHRRARAGADDTRHHRRSGGRCNC